MTISYWICRNVLIGPPLRLLTRPRIVGRDLLPETGPVIIAANHCAVIDSLILCLALPRPVTFLAKSDYFTGSGWRGELIRRFFVSVGQIPVDRGGAGAGDAALDAARAVLDAGGVWAIHPEGTRARDGLVHRGHTGVMRVARLTGAPVVPIALRGTARVNPPGRRWPRPGRIEVVIGRPLTEMDSAAPDRIRPDSISADLIRSDTDRLMREIAVLAACDYRDDYARPAAS